MSERHVNVRYMVDDVQNSIDWYTRTLGFKLLSSAAPAFADVERGSLRLLLSGEKSSAGRPMPDGTKPGPGGWNRIELLVDDLAAEVRAATGTGCEVPQRYRDGTGRIVNPAEDPSGNVVELFRTGCPPGSTIRQRFRTILNGTPDGPQFQSPTSTRLYAVRDKADPEVRVVAERLGARGATGRPRRGHAVDHAARAGADFQVAGDHQADRSSPAPA